MTGERKALGRGIGALLPGSPSISMLDAISPATESGSTEIPVDRIDPNPDQPRRAFETDQLQTLVDSIRQHGVIQPIVVRRVGDRFELVVGERRWRATREAGLASIPAVVAEVDANDRLALALIENIQRRDLNAIELAQAFRSLAEIGATQEEIGQRVGLDRSTIANHLRLLELPREYQQDVEEGRLSAGHAKALLGVSNPERRGRLRDRILRDGISVRGAEVLCRASPGVSKRSRPRATHDPDLQRLVDGLRQRLQTRVRIQGQPSRGRIEIEYFSEEDLRRIAGILLGDA